MNEKFYKYYFYGILTALALPIITTPLLINPPAWGKAILFRIILSFLIFVFLLQLSQKKERILILQKLSGLKNRKNPLFLPFWLLIVLFLLFLLSTLFSLDPRFSFWGSPLRGDGFLNFASFIIFAFLCFLTIKKSDWQKLIDFSLIIGILVSLVALFQQFNILGKIFFHYSGRPPGTVGGPIFLSLYLLLLSFITLSSAIKEKAKKKKLFYILTLTLFLFTILLAGSRAVYLGMIIGFVYFIFFLPKKNRLVSILKITFALILLFGAILIYFININPEFLNSGITGRLALNLVKEDPRFSAWLVSLKAIKDYPFLGYGPENFSIAFDRYYDPSLLYLSKQWGSWYDKAHSFVFEIGVAAGLPALIIYLGFFIVIFRRLQKNKDLIKRGLQTTFLAYLFANFFSFDVFSTYLILFFFIAYAFSLLKNHQGAEETKMDEIEAEKTKKEFNPFKSLLFSVIFLLLAGFIWFGGLKPLLINAKVNLADRYARTGQCPEALKEMESNILPYDSIIDSYANLKYIEIIENCGLKTNKEIISKAVSVLKKAAQIRPYYARAWIFLGDYTNILIRTGQIDLAEEADSYFKKALSLSPKREEVFPGWIETGLISGNYGQAEERAGQCLNFNPRSVQCWTLKAISDIYLDNDKEAGTDMAQAVKNGGDKYFFEKTLVNIAQKNLDSKDYRQAQKRTEQCLALIPESAQCWMKKGLTEIYLGNSGQADKDIAEAVKNGYSGHLFKVVEAYSDLAQKTQNYENYEKLFEAYKKLLKGISREEIFYEYASSFLESAEKIKKLEEAREYLKTFPLSLENG